MERLAVEQGGGWERRGSPSIFALLYSPSTYFEAAARRMPVLAPLGVFMIAAFLQVLSFLVLRAPSTVFGYFAMTVGFGLHLLALLSLLFFAAAVIHLFASSFRGEASGWKLVGLFMLCQMPSIFLLPVAIVARAIGSLGWLLYCFAAAFVYLWIFVLMTLAVRANYRVGPAGAFLLIIVPPAAAVAGTSLVFWNTLFGFLLLVAP